MKICPETLLLIAACPVLLHGACAHHRASTRSTAEPVPSPITVSASSPPRFVSANAYFHFLLARLAVERMHYDRALYQLRQSLSFDPESVYLRTQIAESLLVTGHVDEAIAEAEQALARTNGQTAEVRLLLARCYLAARDFDQAEAQLRALLQATPQHRQAAEMLAEIAMHQGDEAQAIELFSKLATRPGDDGGAYRQLGRLLLRRGLADRAIPYLRLALQVEPNHTDNLELLIAAHESLGQLAEATAAAQQLTAAYPEEPSFWIEYGRLLARSSEPGTLPTLAREIAEELPDRYAQVLLADALARGGADSIALEHLARLLRTDPGYDEALLRAATIHARKGRLSQARKLLLRIVPSSPLRAISISELAEVFIRLGQPRAALTLLTRELRDAPDAVEVRLKLAEVQVRLDRPTEALETIAAMGSGTDREGDVVAARSQILYETHAIEQSIECVRAALRSNPEHPQLLILLAIAYDRAGRFEEGTGAAWQVLAERPNDLAALNFLAYSSASRDQELEQALEWARTARMGAPDDGYIADTLGFVLFKLGRLQEAEQLLRAADDLAPDTPEILLHLGDVDRALGREQQAQNSFRRGLQLLPRDRTVRRSLQQRLPPGRHRS